MIDVHFHALPGIDDGPGGWDEAVALCRAAAEEGTTVIVATPHVLRDPWLNEDREERRALLAELNARLGGTPRVLPGCEYFFGSDAVELTERALAGEGPLEFLGGGELRGTGTAPGMALGTGPHLLVEFAPGWVPREAQAAFHELVVMGVTPVVAHPERNLVLSRDPALMEALVTTGAKAQVTAGSLVGEFGRTVQSVAAKMIELGLAHLVASDAHTLDERPPRMKAARAWAEKCWGIETAARLCPTGGTTRGQV